MISLDNLSLPRINNPSNSKSPIESQTSNPSDSKPICLPTITCNNGQTPITTQIHTNPQVQSPTCLPIIPKKETPNAQNPRLSRQEQEATRIIYPALQILYNNDKIVGRPAKCNLCDAKLKWERLIDRNRHVVNKHGEQYRRLLMDQQYNKLLYDNSAINNNKRGPGQKRKNSLSSLSSSDKTKNIATSNGNSSSNSLEDIINSVAQGKIKNENNSNPGNLLTTLSPIGVAKSSSSSDGQKSFQTQAISALLQSIAGMNSTACMDPNNAPDAKKAKYEISLKEEYDEEVDIEGRSSSAASSNLKSPENTDLPINLIANNVSVPMITITQEQHNLNRNEVNILRHKMKILEAELLSVKIKYQTCQNELITTKNDLINSKTNEMNAVNKYCKIEKDYKVLNQHIFNASQNIKNERPSHENDFSENSCSDHEVSPEPRRTSIAQATPSTTQIAHVLNSTTHESDSTKVDSACQSGSNSGSNSTLGCNNSSSNSITGAHEHDTETVNAGNNSKSNLKTSKICTSNEMTKSKQHCEKCSTYENEIKNLTETKKKWLIESLISVKNSQNILFEQILEKLA